MARTLPRWETCPHCGEKHDTSGRYTSPANQERDRVWWAAHRRGDCAAANGETR